VILARTQRSLGRREEARVTYDDALAVASGRRDRITALTRLGAIYRDLGQPALAERAARSVLGEDPRDS
jgi:tetratricopeptide (TPR) repeat protein